MIAYIQLNYGLALIGNNRLRPDVTFRSFCMLRCLHPVKAVYQVNSNQSWIYHYPFRRHRMCTYTFDFYYRTAGIESFINNFAQFTTVNSISKSYRKFTEIHFLCSAQSTFFIRHKGYIDISVLQVFILHQSFQCNHYICYGSLVISAQYTCTISANYILTFIF